MTGLVKIRRAGASDVPAVAAITDAAYAKWIPLIGRKPLPMTVDYHVAVQTHMIDLALIDLEVVALVEMINKNDHLMIENLAVVPSHQIKGLGKQLLRHAENVALSLNLPALRLITNATFQSNIEFYQRNGFLIDRLEPFRGGAIVHMSKKIV